MPDHSGAHLTRFHRDVDACAAGQGFAVIRIEGLNQIHLGVERSVSGVGVDRSMENLTGF
jgi:hypothetical protein